MDIPFKTFYITGLPHSRVAWLAVALSDWNQSACLHEPMLRWPEPILETAVAEMSKCRTPFVGIADCGLVAATENLAGLLSGPSLIVWRNPMDVLTSLTADLPKIDPDQIAGMLAILHNHLIEFRARYSPMIVAFDDLSNMQTMRDIWHHLLPGVKFQKRRIESLQRLRIDPDPAQLLDGAVGGQMTRVRALITTAPANETTH